MHEDGTKVPPTFKDEIASGIGGSEAKLQHVKHQKFDQSAPSNQSDDRGSTLAASKPQSTKRRARWNNRNPARLNDSAARHPKWKRPNAQKSGVFADPVILPGEDPREFEALHAALIEEWKPSGPSEQSKVFGIADAEWRKLRSRRFADAKAISNSMRPEHPAFDETRGLIAFGFLICREPETAFAEHASKYLRADKIRHLNQKFPRQNFESTEEWALAVVDEIKSGSQCRCARVCPSHVLSFLLKGAAPTLIALGRVAIHRRWNGSEFCRQAYEFRLRSNPAGVLRRRGSSFRVWWFDKPVVSDCDRSTGRVSISGCYNLYVTHGATMPLCPSVFTPQNIVRMRELAENGKSASETALVIGATTAVNRLS